MASPPRVPRNDQEEAADAYQATLPRLARVMAKWSRSAVRGMRRDVRELMERTGYAPAQSHEWANRAADSTALNRLMELAELAPKSIRDATVRRALSRIASGTLTNRRILKEMFRLEAYALVDALRVDVAGLLIGVAEEGMYRGQFMLQKAVGVGWDFDTIGERQVRTFVGHRFSQSDAYQFLKPLVDQAGQRLEVGIALEMDIETIDDDMRTVQDTSEWRAKREARTRITQVSNDAHMQEYEAAGVSRYQIQATYDERTCPTCGRLDQRTFKVSEAKVGRNFPPLHPNCRCVTVAAVSPELAKTMQRRYTDRATGRKHDIPWDFSYQDWYRTFGPGRTDGAAYVPKRR